MTDDLEQARYEIFKRTWWAKNSKGQWIPSPGKRRHVTYVTGITRAREFCTMMGEGPETETTRGMKHEFERVG